MGCKINLTCIGPLTRSESCFVIRLHRSSISHGHGDLAVRDLHGMRRHAVAW
jgi:hypothetical protein